VETHRFRRNAPQEPYVVDFCCLQLALAIEADGSQHSDSESNRRRDAWLAEQGYRDLRFWNNDIQKSFDGVIEAIMHALTRHKADIGTAKPRA